MTNRTIYTNNIELEAIKFPAPQVLATDPNTLDDYEEGTWTPVLTSVTPGDLSVTYSSQYGFYTKIGNVVHLWFNIVTSAFTYTTATGNLWISGVTYASGTTTGNYCYGSVVYGGITKAGYSVISPRLFNGSNTVEFLASGSAQVISPVAITNLPSAGNVTLQGYLCYRTL